MTLEELIGSEDTNEIAGKPFGINPDITYNPDSDEVRREFVERAGDLFDVEGYYGKLRENTGDVGALKDLTGIALNYMAGDKRTNFAIMQDPHRALSQADLLVNAGYVSMARFVENNRDAILDRLSVEQLYSLFNRIPLYKTGDEKHDRIIVLRNKLIQISQAAQKGGDIGSVVEGELKELIEKMPEEQKAFLQENSEQYLQSLRKAIIGKIQKAYSSLFRLGDGETLDKSALRKYLEDNYKVIEDITDDKDRPENERLEIWDKNLKSQYVEIARELYSPEKKILKRDKDEDKENRKGGDKAVGVER